MKTYVNPANALTSGSLVSGFAALILASNRQLGWAAGLIGVAALCDSFDGIVARRCDCECDFGKRLDSLADLLSFGAAPALILYLGGLFTLPVIGVGACLAFVLCGSWRLARFLVIDDHDGYIGLPIPPAGVIAAALAALGPPAGVTVAVTVVLAAMMVSELRFPTLGALVRLRLTPRGLRLKPVRAEASRPVRR